MSSARKVFSESPPKPALCDIIEGADGPAKAESGHPLKLLLHCKQAEGEAKLLTPILLEVYFAFFGGGAGPARPGNPFDCLLPKERPYLRNTKPLPTPPPSCFLLRRRLQLQKQTDF